MSPPAEKPLVSILIPCFNAQQWIGKAIESALGQTYDNCEVIVLDDGSTDDSPAVIRQFEDEVRIESGPNQGGNAARNRLLGMARGEWLQYLDADDLLNGEKIERQADFVMHNPATDVVYGPITYEHQCPDGRVEREVDWLPTGVSDQWVLLARWLLPQTGAPLWRKQAIIDVGGWRPDQPCCQEHELYFRLLKSRKCFRYLAVPGAVYRIWSQDTVCRKDEPATREVRLKLLTGIQDFLAASGQLTAERLHAINLTRFESARIMWIDEPGAARAVMNQVMEAEPTFKPEGKAAPLLYRTAFGIGGFSLAEKAASFKRRFRT